MLPLTSLRAPARVNMPRDLGGCSGSPPVSAQQPRQRPVHDAPRIKCPVRVRDSPQPFFSQTSPTFLTCVAFQSVVPSPAPRRYPQPRRLSLVRRPRLPHLGLPSSKYLMAHGSAAFCCASRTQQAFEHQIHGCTKPRKYPLTRPPPQPPGFPGNQGPA